MRQLIKWLSTALTMISAAALVLMMLQVNMDVIGRFIFNAPMPLTMEMVSYYYMVAIAMLPLANLERRGKSLVHVELLYGLMPATLRHWVLVLALLVSAVFFAYAAYAAWKPAMMAYQIGAYAGSITKIAVWPTRFFPVIGFSMIALVLFLKAWMTIVRAEEGALAEDAPHGHAVREGTE